MNETYKIRYFNRIIKGTRVVRWLVFAERLPVFLCNRWCLLYILKQDARCHKN